MRGIVLLGIAVLVWPASVTAQGDPERGAALAAAECAQCHDISAEGEPKTYPPSFASIAWYREEEQIRARILYPQLHGAMPLTRVIGLDDINDLVAYIVSLDNED
jgi:mono/diheme cytochrome c family protein